MNEWGFAAEIKSWWDADLSRQQSWRLDRCEVERQEEGSHRRSDLVVNHAGTVQLAGELRLPDHPQSSPWHPENMGNAIDKAITQGARWAFTSDATELVLIDTQAAGPPQARVRDRVPLAPFTDRADLGSGSFLERCHEAWTAALHRIAPIVLGLVAPPGMSPDSVFINSLRALLRAPVAAVRDELNRRRQRDPVFEAELVKWMVDEQGWDHAPDAWEQEVARAARLTCYVLTTRLMFHGALRRSQPRLATIEIAENAPAAVVRATLAAYFQSAIDLSGDYATLFRWDTANEYALCADAAVPGWRRVLDHLDVFDLATVGYDVIGRLFERLIEPHERYRWGQHYTNPDVCDLMLSLALPDGVGTVLDPAVGGGTFLVRAYVRQRVFNPAVSHQDLLASLYGIDVSALAASLATVNLAVRDLSFADNYPRIATGSFLSMRPQQQIMTLPLGGPSVDPVDVIIDPVDAVVCNPPYVRSQEIGPERQAESQQVLQRNTGHAPPPGRLHRHANYYVYFWLHAGQFVAPGGRAVFITAGEWLDSDYGAAVQKWMLDHFVIEACIESMAEPWFHEARVGTVIVSVRMCGDEEERAANQVRFVTLRKPLRELYGPTETDEAQVAAVDALRDRLFNLTMKTGESDDFDWSLVTQKDLHRLGTDNGHGG